MLLIHYNYKPKHFLLNELSVYKSKLDYSCVICFLFDRWEVDDWGPCSKTCGGGFRERKVSCVSDRGGKKIKVRKHKSVNYDISFKTISDDLYVLRYLLIVEICSIISNNYIERNVSIICLKIISK